MIIDNGERLPLSIFGVFEGICGFSRGVIAFTPNQFSRPAAAAKGALLNGEAVFLMDVALAEDGRSYLARYRPAQ